LTEDWRIPQQNIKKGGQQNTEQENGRILNWKTADYETKQE
jgi:hypothetical protein